jgi:CBS domain-containing protein
MNVIENMAMNAIENMTEIRDIMETNVITVGRRTPILDAIETLVKHNFTGLPVVDKRNHVIGIVTEKDILALALSIRYKTYGSSTISSKVEDFMTTNVVTVDVNEPFKQICTSLMKHPFRRIPITEKGKVVGIVSRKDIIAYIMHIKG